VWLCEFGTSCEDHLDGFASAVAQERDRDQLEDWRESTEGAGSIDEVCLYRDNSWRADLIDERAKWAGKEGLCTLSIVCTADSCLGVLEYKHGRGSRLGEGGNETPVERQQMVATKSVLGELLAERRHVQVDFGGITPPPSLALAIPDGVLVVVCDVARVFSSSS